MERVVRVIDVLHAAVLLDLGGVGQVDGVVLGAQAIHQPMPVKRRFDRRRLKLRLEGLKERHYLRQVAIEFAMGQALAVLVDGV